ncbi:hypothetical protein BDN71DRAFT_1510661 [Pleurotus eryngii]|uniref:Uncharacterized protein n=1 Tax=Pleurotus eryngii TaxID=5323 RepID=A0A9P5ZQ42_PLEER|nr:hypothetical protein BDN71DRAFT_1510661 [Pleurotus eryngii]
MTSIVPGKYGDMGSLDGVEIAFQIVKFPIILVSSLIFSPLVWYNKHKTWRRVLGHQAFRWAARLKDSQPQTVEEDIGSNARLLWLGSKQTDHVLLYLHAYLYVLVNRRSIPRPSHRRVVLFLHVQEQLKARSNIDLGMAILTYTLTPEAAFPTPLRQSVAAINYLTSQGVKPENIDLAGDSSESTLKHANSDIIPPKNLREWGGYVLADVPVNQRGYVEALKAPDDWFKNMDGVVDRNPITAGSQECLRDDILAFNEKLKKTYKGKSSFVLQRGGVHDDIFLDFLVNETKLGELTPMIIEWLAAGYE